MSRYFVMGRKNRWIDEDSLCYEVDGSKVFLIKKTGAKKKLFGHIRLHDWYDEKMYREVTEEEIPLL